MSPGLLVERMAAILGLPQKSIVVIDRALLEAGLRTRGGRGRSAARVTVADGATLLLAVLVTPILVRADEAIEIWRDVKTWPHPPSVAEPFGSMLSGARPVPLCAFFERLIETPPENCGGATFVLQLAIDQYAGMLKVHRPGEKETKAGFLRDPETGSNKPVSPSSNGDLTRDAKVTQKTFQELHKLFYSASGTNRQAVNPRRRGS